jgi:uncharacterized repeat protein (TIGR03803 family)
MTAQLAQLRAKMKHQVLLAAIWAIWVGAFLAAASARGQGVWSYNGPLYSFGTRAFEGDGMSPDGGVVVSPDRTTLYGTTYRGGKFGKGTVFAFNLATSQLTTLWDFGNIASDGAYPIGNLVLANGFLYGTTSYGGDANGTGYTGFGVVYRVDTSGQHYKLLHPFTGGTTGDGSRPRAGLVISRDGATLYGTTFVGGANNLGIVFALSTEGDSVYYKGLHQFTYGFNNDGQNPEAGLVLSLDGTMLYGTTTSGGNAAGDGTVFALSINGDTGNSGYYQVLYRFHSNPSNGDGFRPVASLKLSSDGATLYGTTFHGGDPSDNGTVFKIGTSGNETMLVSFSDGTMAGLGAIGGPLEPAAGLTLVGHWLFGTTFYGGGGILGNSNPNLGTIFAVDANLTTAAIYNGAQPYFDLHDFAGVDSGDGAGPAASLTYQDASPYPVLYGTTEGRSERQGHLVFDDASHPATHEHPSQESHCGRDRQ